MRHTSDAMDAGLAAMLRQGQNEHMRMRRQPIYSRLTTCALGAGMTALLLTLLLVACAGPAAPAALPPTQAAATIAPAPTLTPTFASTIFSEPADTPAAPERKPRPPLTAELLIAGLSIVGSDPPIAIPIPSQEPPATRTPVVQTDTAIFQQAQILFRTSLSGFVEEPSQTASSGLSALKFVNAELATYGSEGLNIEIQTSFPQLPLNVARLTLGKLAEDNPPSLYLKSSGGRLAVHRDAHVTIIGYTGGQVLVSVSDSSRPSGNCEFIALIGQEELADLLRQNGYQLAGNEQGGLVISQDGSGILHPVQQIKDDKFIQKEIIPEMGATFVDELINAGKTSAHPFPVVPFPDAGIFSSPTDPTALKYQTSPDGRTVTAVDADGKILAIATYNPQKVNDPLSPEVAAWEWKEVTNEIRAGKFILTPVELKAGDGVYAELTKYLFQIDKIDLAVFKGRIFKDQDGTIFVLPPGVDTTQPMPWAEWLTKYSTLQNFKDGIIKNDEFVRLDSRKVVFIGANAIFVFPDDISVISAIPKIITQTNSASISHAMGNKIGSQQLEVRWNEKWKTAIAFDDMLIVYKYNDDNKWQELSPLDTEAQLKQPSQVVDEWLDRVELIDYTSDEKEKLRQFLGLARYVKQEQLPHIREWFPWFHLPIPVDNPVHLIKKIQTITNNAGSGMSTDFSRTAIKLDYYFAPERKYTENTRWLLQVDGLFKEALTLALIRESQAFSKSNDHYCDIAPTVLGIIALQNLLETTDEKGRPLIADTTTREEIGAWIKERKDQINKEAAFQKWTSTYP